MTSLTRPAISRMTDNDVGKHSATAARLEWLRSRGVVTGPSEKRTPLKPIARRPGALARFLADRNE